MKFDMIEKINKYKLIIGLSIFFKLLLACLGKIYNGMSPKIKHTVTKASTLVSKFEMLSIYINMLFIIMLIVNAFTYRTFFHTEL